MRMSMTYDEAQMTSMGILNAGWGICGVTSTFYAMYQLNAGARGALINAPRPFSVLAEIKSYLQQLKADGETEKLNDIKAFTRTFGVVDKVDFRTFTVDGYIAYINATAQKYTNTGPEKDKEIVKDGAFSIALPPAIVADYIQRIWGWQATVSDADQGGDAIIGVKSSDNWFNSFRAYKGLVHYVYRKNGQFYSWGNKPKASLAGCSADFQFCWSIKVAAV
jgi:hypothetical protein